MPGKGKGVDISEGAHTQEREKELVRRCACQEREEELVF
jgi:hypothetical protein